jgi:hypothetical protein
MTGSSRATSRTLERYVCVCVCVRVVYYPRNRLPPVQLLGASGSLGDLFKTDLFKPVLFKRQARGHSG